MSTNRTSAKRKIRKRQSGRGISDLLTAGGALAAALPAIAMGVPLLLGKKLLGGKRRRSRKY